MAERWNLKTLFRLHIRNCSTGKQRSNIIDMKDSGASDF